MQNILGIIDAGGLVLALVALFMSVKLVFRTEKDLDMAAKMLMGSLIVLTLSNLTSINDYLSGIVPNDLNRIIFHVSRVLSLVFLIASIHYLIKITEKKLN